MKYKLINKQTGEEHHCYKVTIDGFDYYVSDEKLQIGDYLQRNNDLPVLYTENFWFDFGVPYKKVIATNNPSIDIPKVVNEVDVWINETTSTLKDVHTIKTSKMCLKAGYTKSQETHPFSEEDMIEFHKWAFQQVRITESDLTTKELLQIWKEQKPKIIYYE